MATEKQMKELLKQYKIQISKTIVLGVHGNIEPLTRHVESAKRIEKQIIEAGTKEADELSQLRLENSKLKSKLETELAYQEVLEKFNRLLIDIITAIDSNTKGQVLHQYPTICWDEDTDELNLAK